MRYLILLALVGSLGCATLRQSNGSLNIPLILSDAQWGVSAACSQLWLTPDACTFATDALNVAQSIAVRNLTGGEKAVRQSLVDTEAKLPSDSRVRPYLDAVIALLPA